MALRYTQDDLIHLRQSPLCVAPPNLPPAEEWMGPPPETFRNQPKVVAHDRAKTGDSAVLNPESRRPAVDRNNSRNPTNPEDIILGPPRTSFASSTTARSSRPGEGERERTSKDLDRTERPADRAERFGSFRSRVNDVENSSNNDNRFRDGRDGRSSNNNNNNSSSITNSNEFRRRGDQDQDNEGWSTVKPRKSFGHEGAERFRPTGTGTGTSTGAGIGTRIGGERFARGAPDTRKPPRERGDERDNNNNGERRSRNFESYFGKDKDGDDADGLRRNGLARGRSEPWFKDQQPKESSDSSAHVMTQRERIDRAKSWRDRDPEDINRLNDRNGDRGERHGTTRATDRPYERRWDRDRDMRVERDPEWLDEPAEEKTQGHTEEDFKKFMESMKARRTVAKPDEKPMSILEERVAPDVLIEPEPKVASPPPPAVQPGPDKFFMQFTQANLETSTPSTDAKEGAKPKATSRFMGFLKASEDSRARTEPSTPAVAGLPNMGSNSSTAGSTQSSSNEEKEAFAMLIQKLQMSGVSQSQHQPQHQLLQQLQPQHQSPPPPQPQPQLQPMPLPQQLPPPQPPPLQPQQHQHQPQMPAIQLLQAQRVPPPGLDHPLHPFNMAGNGQMPPPRPMIPPPGLINVNPPRNLPISNMFAPNFPPGAFPPPHEGMGVGVGMPPPPRSMQPPPGFFGGPPPPQPQSHQFMPPPGMGGFEGPNGPAFAAHFDRRGMLPPGAGAYRGP